MKRKRLFRLLAVSLAILLSCSVAELGLRLVWRQAKVDNDAQIKRIGEDPMAQLYMFSDNEKLVFEHRPNVRVVFPQVDTPDGPAESWTATTDSRGLRRGLRRGGREFPADAKPLRVICLGDSISFGVGLNDEQTIPARLASILGERLGEEVECPNFGVANYNTVQELAFFKHKEGLKYEPQLVVLGFFINDFSTRPGRIAILNEQVKLVEQSATFSVGSLRLWQLAKNAAGALSHYLPEGEPSLPSSQPVPARKLKAVRAAIEELRQLLDSRHIPLLVVLFPRDWQLEAADRADVDARQRAISEFCLKQKIACIDLLDNYHGTPVSNYYRPGDDSHPNASTAQQIAEIVAAEIVGKKLLARRTDRE